MKKSGRFNSEIFIGTEGNITQLSTGGKKRRWKLCHGRHNAFNVAIPPKCISRFSIISTKISKNVFFPFKKLVLTYTYMLKHMRSELRFLTISKNQLKHIMDLNVKTILRWILEENEIDSLSSLDITDIKVTKPSRHENNVNGVEQFKIFFFLFKKYQWHNGRANHRA